MPDDEMEDVPMTDEEQERARAEAEADALESPDGPVDEAATTSDTATDHLDVGE